MPQHKLYAIEPWDTLAIPFIVTTAYQNLGGYPKAEWFLAVPDSDCTFFARRIRFNIKNFPAGEVELDEAFMLREAFEQAKSQLRVHLAKINVRRNFHVEPSTLIIREENEDFFVHCWVRNICKDQIANIAQKTEHEPLANFLNWVIDLPQIEVQDA